MTTKRKLYYIALKEYKIIDIILYRKVKEKITNDDQIIQISKRRVVLDDDLYYIIKNTYVTLDYQGRDKTFKLLERDYFYISRDEVN